MRILIKENAYKLYNSQFGEQGIPDQAHLFAYHFMGGKWYEVETEHLFNDQFNIGGVPGIIEAAEKENPNRQRFFWRTIEAIATHGMRIFSKYVEKVDGDIRPGTFKCGYCFKCWSGYRLGENKIRCPSGCDPSWRTVFLAYPYSKSGAVVLQRKFNKLVE